MDLDDVEKLRGDIEDLRRRLANVSRRELTSLAQSLRRSQRKASTKHPMYDSAIPGRPPLSIPNNPGKWTVKSILDVLERDLDALEGDLRGKPEGQDHGEY